MTFDFEDKKVFITQIISFYKERGYTLRNHINPILKKCGLDTKISWHDTIDMIAGLKECDINNDITQKALNELLEYLISTILYKEKFIYIYKDLANFDEIYQAIDEHSSPYQGDFLSIINQDTNFDCVKFKKDKLTHYIYKNIQTLSAKIDLGVYALKDDVQQEGYDKVFAYKTIDIMAFNGIIFDEENKKIILSADLSSKLPEEMLRNQLIKIVRHIREYTNTRTQSTSHVIKDYGINLFSCIKSLYDERLGKVREMAFTDDEGVTHRAKIRSGIDDVRDTEYHMAGKAVTNIQPYDINKIYNDKTEVAVKVSWHSFQKEQAVTSYAIVSAENE